MSTHVSATQLLKFIWVDRTKVVLVFLTACSIVSIINLLLGNPLVRNGFYKAVFISHVIDLPLAVLSLVALHLKSRFLLLPIMIKQILEIIVRVYFLIFAFVAYFKGQYWGINDGITLVILFIVILNFLIFYCFIKCFKALKNYKEPSSVELVENQPLSA